MSVTSRKQEPVCPNYSGELVPASTDERIAAIANGQWGVVSGDDLRALDLERHEIEYRVRVGRLRPYFRGTYLVGDDLVPWQGRFLAATMATGAPLAGWSAAHLHNVWLSSRRTVDIASSRGAHDRDRIRVRRVRALLPRDVTAVEGIRTVTVAWALLHLAADLTYEQLRTAVARAQHLQIYDHAHLLDVLRRSPNAKGRRKLVRIAEQLADEPVDLRSWLERAFRALLEKHAIPQPEWNAPGFGRYIPDCVWRDERLIVELDGRRTHLTQIGFEDDRERQDELVAAGWRVMRFTYRQLRDRPDWVVRTLLRALATRG